MPRPPRPATVRPVPGRPRSGSVRHGRRSARSARLTWSAPASTYSETRSSTCSSEPIRTPGRTTRPAFRTAAQAFVVPCEARLTAVRISAGCGRRPRGGRAARPAWSEGVRPDEGDVPAIGPTTAMRNVRLAAPPIQMGSSACTGRGSQRASWSWNHMPSNVVLVNAAGLPLDRLLELIHPDLHGRERDAVGVVLDLAPAGAEAEVPAPPERWSMVQMALARPPLDGGSRRCTRASRSGPAACRRPTLCLATASRLCAPSLRVAE